MAASLEEQFLVKQWETAIFPKKVCQFVDNEEKEDVKNHNPLYSKFLNFVLPIEFILCVLDVGTTIFCFNKRFYPFYSTTFTRIIIN